MKLEKLQNLCTTVLDEYFFADRGEYRQLLEVTEAVRNLCKSFRKEGVKTLPIRVAFQTAAQSCGYTSLLGDSVLRVISRDNLVIREDSYEPQGHAIEDQFDLDFTAKRNHPRRA